MNFINNLYVDDLFCYYWAATYNEFLVFGVDLRSVPTVCKLNNTHFFSFVSSRVAAPLAVFVLPSSTCPVCPRVYSTYIKGITVVLTPTLRGRFWERVQSSQWPCPTSVRESTNANQGRVAVNCITLFLKSIYYHIQIYLLLSDTDSGMWLLFSMENIWTHHVFN